MYKACRVVICVMLYQKLVSSCVVGVVRLKSI